MRSEPRITYRTVPALREIRLNSALSQRDLAEQAGVTQATISRLEQGHPARPGTIRKLSAALRVHPKALMGL